MSFHNSDSVRGSNLEEPLLKNMDIQDEELSKYCPRDRVVCASSILWFIVPLYWSWRFCDFSVLLLLSTFATIFLTFAAFNFYLDGSRFTWKMWTDVAAVFILGTVQLLRTVLQANLVGTLTTMACAISFVLFFILNGLQINWANGLARVGADWIFTFITYRWSAVLACLSEAYGENFVHFHWTQPVVLSVIYYTHSMLMWYRAQNMKSEKGIHSCLTWPMNVYWLVESFMVVLVSCLFVFPPPSGMMFATAT
ncbi:unnamed protein product [Effrenium voratum]|nr:unnamed protein product [Effrenium voratum]